MIEKLIEFSARQKYIVLLFTAAVVAFGIWTMYNQPVDAIPDLSDTQVIVYSNGIALLTSSRIRSRILLPQRCSARLRSKRFEAFLTLASPMYTSSSKMGPTSIGPGAEYSSI